MINIPKGWILVPIEPTDKMLAAGFHRAQFLVQSGTIYSEYTSDPAELDESAPAKMWEAMIEVAPALEEN